MPCALPGPRWDNTNRAGLQGATDDTVDSTIILSWGSARASPPATSVYYNVYFSTSLTTLFSSPEVFTFNTSVEIPKSTAGLNYYFAVRAAQRGISSDLSNANISGLHLNDDGYSYPDTTIRTTFSASEAINSDGYLVVDDVSGFPLQDGYLLVDEEIMFYSDAVDGYDGYGAFLITDRDPFGCNTFVEHPDGYEVLLFEGFEDGNGTTFKPAPSCFLNRPTWNDPRIAYRGLQSVQDTGVGQSVKLTWGDADPPSGYSQIHYNIYYASTLGDLAAAAKSIPQALTTQQEATISGLRAGDGYYFAVQASYFTDTFSLNELELIGDNLYSYPPATSVDDDDGYFYENETGMMGVASTSGYPGNGIIKVGSEFMKYDLVLGSNLRIIQRDVFDLDQQTDHPDGTEVVLFKGIEDGNDRFWKTTPTWTNSGIGPRILPVDGYTYFQNDDGYRAVPDGGDNLTEDHSDFEDNNDDFPEKDYCGLRSQDFTQLFGGSQCGTFIGGRPGGIGGGLDVYKANSRRQEFLLGLTGERFVLLRRKWEGRVCPRISLRHEHPHARCGTCYGTGFVGGFDRYSHSRDIRPGETNSNGFIMMRVSPYDNDLGLGDFRGLHQVDQLTAWTLAIPTIKDRDVLIRYRIDENDGSFIEDFRYEVLSVTRNKLVLEKEGRQRVQMRKLDKTEEIYKFDITLS